MKNIDLLMAAMCLGALGTGAAMAAPLADPSTLLSPEYPAATREVPGERIEALRAPQLGMERTGIRVATWNLDWLDDRPLTGEEVARCEQQAQATRSLDARPSPECRKGGAFRTEADYAHLRAHGEALHADVIALQEVHSAEAVQRIFDPSIYDIAVTEGANWQKAGFAIRKDILLPGAAPQFSTFAEIGRPLPRDQRGALEALITLKDGRKLDLLSVHLKAMCVEPALDAGGAHCPILAAQAPILGRWVSERQHAQQPFVVLGDFNRKLDSEVEMSCRGGSDACGRKTLWSWLEAGDPWSAPLIAPTASLRHVPGCFEPKYGNHPIEHIVLGGGAETRLVPGSVRSVPYVDPVTHEVIDDHARSTREFSDHCVVQLDLNLDNEAR